MPRFEGRPSRELDARVESIEPRLLLAAYGVTNTDDTGPGSLRQAILDANAAPGDDEVRFDIPGDSAALKTIKPLSFGRMLRGDNDRKLLEAMKAGQRETPITPAPGTPGDVSGFGDRPRAGRGEGPARDKQESNPSP